MVLKQSRIKLARIPMWDSDTEIVPKMSTVILQNSGIQPETHMVSHAHLNMNQSRSASVLNHKQ